MSNEDYEDDDDDAASTSTKRLAKKKHFPFGTPSHLNHPYSQFAHLTGSTKNFAENLATATGIEAEVLLAEKPQRRKRIPPKVVKAGDQIGLFVIVSIFF